MGFKSALKNLFSSESVIEKAADGVFKGLDAAWHTPEEREGDKQKRIELAIKMIEATKGASPARRNIALIVMFLWGFIGLDVVLLITASAFIESAALSIRIDLAIKALIEFSVSYVMPPSAGVLGFYFLKNIISK